MKPFTVHAIRSDGARLGSILLPGGSVRAGLALAALRFAFAPKIKKADRAAIIEAIDTGGTLLLSTTPDDLALWAGMDNFPWTSVDRAG